MGPPPFPIKPRDCCVQPERVCSLTQSEKESSALAFFLPPPPTPEQLAQSRGVGEKTASGHDGINPAWRERNSGKKSFDLR